MANSTKRGGWEAHEAALERGPGSGGRKILVTTALLMLFGGVLFMVVGNTLGWFGEAAQVAREELGPRAMRDKYEFFKNSSASLDAQSANIEAQKAKLDSIKSMYGEVASKWPEDVRASYSKADTEFRGIIMNYNKTAATYNAEMSQWWSRFTNAGMLPEGASDAPRREFKEYKTQ